MVFLSGGMVFLVKEGAGRGTWLALSGFDGGRAPHWFFTDSVKAIC